MELNITEFVSAADPYNYSDSVAHSGCQNIGRITWKAAQDADFNLLDTADKVAAAIAYFKEFGAWDDLDTWLVNDLNALTIQEISAQLSEARELAPADTWDGVDWDEHQRLAEQGTVSGALFTADDASSMYGRSVYFTMSH